MIRKIGKKAFIYMRLKTIRLRKGTNIGRRENTWEGFNPSTGEFVKSKGTRERLFDIKLSEYV